MVALCRVCDSKVARPCECGGGGPRVVTLPGRGDKAACVAWCEKGVVDDVVG